MKTEEMGNMRKFEQENDIDTLQNELGLQVGFSKYIDCIGEEPKYNFMIYSKKIKEKKEVQLTTPDKAYKYFFEYGHKFHARTFSNLLQRLTDEDYENHVTECFHTRIGWDNLDGEDIFKYQCAVKKDKSEFSTYKGKLKIESRGSFEKYIKGIKNLIVPYPKLLLVYLAGASGLISQRLKLADTNIMMNVCGDSSCGKSISEKVALSFWGNPTELMTSFNSTNNGLEEIMVNRQIMPVVIDDILGAKNYSSERAKKQYISDSIFRFSTGKSKVRYGDNTNAYYGAILLSSETSLLKKLDSGESKGEFYRMIEIPVKKEELTKDVEHSKEIEKLIRWNYGFGAYAFAKHMLTSGMDTEALETLYDDYVEKITNNEQIVRYPRIANRFAIIAVTAHIMKDCFGFEIDIDDIINVLITSFMQSMNYKESKTEIYFKIKKFVGNHTDLFSKNRASYEENKHLGAFDKDMLGNPTVCVKTNKLAPLIAALFMQEGIEYNCTAEGTKVDVKKTNVTKFSTTDLNNILAYWKKQGWLECLHGNKVKRKLGTQKEVLMYNIILGNEGEEEYVYA